MPQRNLKEQLTTLIEDYRDLNSGPIPVQPIPTAVEFAKQVSKGYPSIYEAYRKTKGDDDDCHITTDQSLLEWPAFKWTRQDLLNLIDEKIEVAVTPNGRADDVHYVDGETEPVFLAPATIEMTIEELLDKVSPSEPSQSSQKETNNTHISPVYYLQSQNSNLTTTPLARIVKHIPQNFPFAEPVLPTPEAINIWIGDQRSITSTHRDPYENLYLVLKGSKTFTLYPPIDEITLPTRLVQTGTYIYDTSTNTFSTTLDESKDPSQPPPRIPWVVANPLLPRDLIIAQHALYALATPRTITVREGQILYLPSGWYHHVQQECGTWAEDGGLAPCIAVNYWYDMEYEGEKYVMRQLIGRLKAQMLEEEERDKQELEALKREIGDVSPYACG